MEEQNPWQSDPSSPVNQPTPHFGGDQPPHYPPMHPGHPEHPVVPPSRWDPSKIALAASILVAALLISGTLIFINRQKTPATAEAPDTAKHLKQWAKDIGLNTKQFNSCLDSSKFKSVIDQDLADGTRLGVQGTPGFFVDDQVIEGAQPFSEFQKAIEAALKKKVLPAKNTAALNIANGKIMGDPNAPVTVLEFTDMQCPFCRAFWKDTLPQIINQYVNTGKIRFVYRAWPLSFHPAATPSALAIECANEQGKAWQMHDKIFSEEDKLGQGTVQF